MSAKARAARCWNDERGVALPIALIALVAVTILVTGVLVGSTTNNAITGAQQDGKRGLYRAEGALEQYIQSQVDGTGSTLAPMQPTVTTLADGSRARITVAQLGHRWNTATLGQRYYAVTAEPVRANGEVLGRSVVSMVPVAVQRIDLNLNITGAATIASKDVEIKGSSYVSGRQDSRLCTTGTDLKAVTLGNDADNVRIDERNIDGGMAQVETSTRTGAELASHALDGNAPRLLAKYATIKYGFDGKPAWADQDPDSDLPRANPLNWGCPMKLLSVIGESGQCSADEDVNYFPVIAIDVGTGAAKLNQGHGQGMLIILGDLDITGKFFFSGVVIVTGKTFIRGSGGDSRIDGALISLGNVFVDPTTGGGTTTETTDITGNAKIFYNSCTVGSAVSAFKNNSSETPIQLGRASNLRPEGWLELVR